MPGDIHRRYPPELKERAVRMVAEIREEHDSEWAAMTRSLSRLVGQPSARNESDGPAPSRVRWPASHHQGGSRRAS